MSCADVRAEQGLLKETWMHIHITDSYNQKDDPKHFSLKLALEDDLYDIEKTLHTKSTWGCYFPIRGLSDHTDKK